MRVACELYNLSFKQICAKIKVARRRQENPSNLITVPRSRITIQILLSPVDVDACPQAWCRRHQTSSFQVAVDAKVHRSPTGCDKTV